MRIAPILIAVCLCAPALNAQVMGSTNQDAPTLTSSITFQDGGSVAIEYRALAWASGAWWDRIQENEGMRSFVNSRASAAPIGTLTVKGKAKLDGAELPEGSHDLYFTVDGKGTWTMNLRPEESESDEAAVQKQLKLAKTQSKQSRLVLSLVPVEDAGAVHFGIEFGDRKTKLPIAQ